MKMSKREAKRSRKRLIGRARKERKKAKAKR